MTSGLAGAQALIEFGRQLGMSLPVLSYETGQKKSHVAMGFSCCKPRQNGEIFLKFVSKSLAFHTTCLYWSFSRLPDAFNWCIIMTTFMTKFLCFTKKRLFGKGTGARTSPSSQSCVFRRALCKSAANPQ